MADAREVHVWTQHAADQMKLEAYTPATLAEGDKLQRILYQPGEIWDSALDFGCGTGLWRRHFRENYVGVDQNPAMIDGARRRWPYDEFHCVSGISDGARMPFEDGRFDLVFTSAVLQHSTDADKAGVLREIRRVLHVGGRLVCYENTFWERNPGAEDGRSHTQEGWRQLIEPFGFARVSVEGDLHVFRAI